MEPIQKHEEVKGPASGAARGAAPAAKTRLEAELELEVEAVWEMKTGRIVGAEIFPLWVLPGGRTRRASSIRAVDDTGPRSRLGILTLRRLVKALSSWHEVGLDLDFVSINAQATGMLQEGGFFRMLETVLCSGLLGRTRLVVEVNAEACRGEVATRLLDRLRKLGVPVALDHFGGDSNLFLIHQPQVQMVKLDASLVHRENERSIADILSYARSAAREVVALGVDDPREAELLKTLGCRCGQGSLFSAPLQVDRMFRWICDLQVAAGG